MDNLSPFMPVAILPQSWLDRMFLESGGTRPLSARPERPGTSSGRPTALRNRLLGAAACGDWNVVKECLDRKVSVNAQDAESGMTCAHFAAVEVNSDVMKFLVEEGADLEIPDLNSEIVIDYVRRSSTVSQDPSTAKELEAWLFSRLSPARKILHAPPLSSLTTLEQVVSDPQVAPADLDVTVRGHTPATLFASRNDIAHIQMLARKEVDFSLANAAGDTVLHCLDYSADTAVGQSMLLECLEWFLTTSAKRCVNALDKSSCTPAFRCVANADDGEFAHKCLTILHKAGAKFSVRDGHGRTLGMCLAEQLGSGPWLDWVESVINEPDAECELGQKLSHYIALYDESEDDD